MPHKTCHALILAAGMGKRLGELTRNRTKCMVPFLNSTILQRMLGQLESHGFERVTIVTGYCGDSLKEQLGPKFGGMKLQYIDNPVYDKTNNIYSLFLAKEKLLEEDTLLLESDLVFDDDVLSRILEDPRPDLAVVAAFKDWMDGTVLTLDKNDRILGFIPKERFQYDQKNEYFKTVNIYRFSRSFSQSYYVPFLEAYCKAMGHNEYYEQVLRILTHLDHSPLRGIRLENEKWYEIDDASDLANAETLLASEDQAYAAYTARYGGYWRFPMLLDYCYLVNPYFPTPGIMNEIKSSLETLITQYPSGQEVNRTLAARMFHLSPDRILVGNGAAELIQAIEVEENTCTGIIRPSFEEYAARIGAERCKVFETKSNDFRYDTDELVEFATNQRLGRLVLINPDNPTGHYLRSNKVTELARKLDAIGCRLILDESFADFAEEQVSFLNDEWLQSHKNLVVIKSISKSYGVPGLRLGVIASADTKLIEKCKKNLAIWNINSFGEYFMQIVGKHESEYKNACLRLIHERNRFADCLKESPILNVYPSQANYLFCKVKAPFTPSQLAQELLNRYNILIRDCSKKPGMDGPFIRIAVRTEEENNRLLDAIDEISGTNTGTLPLTRPWKNAG